jgi:hypothetical protein
MGHSLIGSSVFTIVQRMREWPQLGSDHRYEVDSQQGH